MNELGKHYLEVSAELQKQIDTIPVDVQKRMRCELLTNPNYEPCVVAPIELKRVDQYSLHKVLAYDKAQQRWLSVVDLPEQIDADNYVFYAPLEWQLCAFILMRLDTAIDHLNKHNKQPENNMTIHIFIGEWTKEKCDNLISVGTFLGLNYYATLHMEYLQTEDQSKALFYYDWNTHKYYKCGKKDVSDPTKYIMFMTADYLKYAPQTVDDRLIYALNGIDRCPRKICIDLATDLMTAEEFKAAYPEFWEQINTAWEDNLHE